MKNGVYVLDKLQAIIKDLQKSGLPIFFIQDPITLAPSVSLTMLVVSFTICVMSLLNKFAKVVDGVDMDGSLELLIITSSLYFGRSLSKKMNKNEKTEE